MPRTILRIKRRRTDEPLPFLRLEGLVPQDISGGMQQASAPEGSNKKRGRSGDEDRIHDLASTTVPNFQDSQQTRLTSSVLWKRLEPVESENKQAFRVVDALLEQPVGGAASENDGRQSKRRKLTVLETTSGQVDLFGSSMGTKVSQPKKCPLKVLDPLTRLVDDSLQEVHAGKKAIAEHYRLVTTDPRLARHNDVKKWLQWSHSSSGNLLHACALWNDVEMTGDLLQVDDNLSRVLCEAVDADGRTPYEVAQLSGHDSVCEVLEAFGGDTTNFVYDIFCLDDDGGKDPKATKDEDISPAATVELTSGVAYWTPEGELILEAHDESDDVDDQHLDDDEIDSNCEEYGANDYPEEEDAWGYSDAYDGMDPYEYPSHLTGGNMPIGGNQESCALDRKYMQHAVSGDLYPGEEEEYNEYAGDLYDEYD